MPASRANPNRIKLHRSYDVGELAARLGVLHAPLPDKIPAAD